MDKGYIKLSNDLLLVSEEDSHDFLIVDPRTSGILETYNADGKLAAKKVTISTKFGHILFHLKEKSILEFYHIGSVKAYLKCSLPEVLTSFALSHDNYLFYGGGTSGVLYIWDTLTGEQLKRIKAHPKTISKIVVSEDGGLILTSGADLVINVWLYSQIFASEAEWRLEVSSSIQEISDVRPIHTLVRHVAPITDMMLAPKTNGKLASCSADKTCIIWDCYKGTIIKDIRCEAEITCLYYDHLDDRVFLGLKNSKVVLYYLTDKFSDLRLDTAGRKEGIPNTFDIQKQSRDKVEFLGHEGEITNMVYYSELDYLITGAADGKIIFWSADGQIIKQMHMFKKGVANIKAFERSKEYDASLTNATKIKKFVEFKAFRKHEEKTTGHIDAHNVTIFPEHRIHKNAESLHSRTQGVYQDFVDCTLDFYLGENFSTVEKTEAPRVEGKGKGKPQEVPAQGGSELQKLKEENAKLKALTQELFNKCYAQGKP